MSDDEGPIMEGGGKGKLYYSQNIMNQIDRIGKRASEPLDIDDRSRESFKNSIRGFDSIMRPFRDREYEISIDAIKAASPSKSINSIQDFFDMFGLLCLLVKRAGLMPMDEISMVDDDGESYNPLAKG